ncbi:MAG: alpha/beta hydrolase family protein, partial [Thermomicrobiales bacterium]
MSLRNLSPQHMFEQMALAHPPEAKFAAFSADDFATWKSETLPRVIATLGDMPERVPLNPQLLAEWEMDGLKRQKWLIDVGLHISATLFVNIPGDLADGQRRPAILCWHGHGKFGKEIVMGTGATPEAQDSISRTNYNFGFQMAQRGYVTYAIDWIGRGERNDNAKPNLRNTDRGRDWCNLYYLSATMLGMTSIGINATHGMA